MRIGSHFQGGALEWRVRFHTTHWKECLQVAAAAAVAEEDKAVVAAAVRNRCSSRNRPDSKKGSVHQRFLPSGRHH